MRSVVPPRSYIGQLSLRRRIEFILDASLLALSLLLLAPRSTGLPLHEWLGIGVAVPIIVHILLSWRWIRTSTRRVIGRPTPRLRLNYSINALLFVLFVLVIGSGIVISQVAVPILGFRTIDDRAWRALHNQSTNFLLVAAASHIAMNWSWVRRTAQRAMWHGPLSLRPIQAVAFLRSVARAIIVLVAAGFIIAVALAYVGRPKADRRYTRNEIARFAGSPAGGVVQLAGEGFLLLAVGYTARKVFRLRL
jgi:hypothetical protein